MLIIVGRQYLKIHSGRIYDVDNMLVSLNIFLWISEFHGNLAITYFLSSPQIKKRPRLSTENC